jgi:hypothetical protein
MVCVGSHTAIASLGSLKQHVFLLNCIRGIPHVACAWGRLEALQQSVRLACEARRGAAAV